MLFCCGIFFPLSLYVDVTPFRLHLVELSDDNDKLPLDGWKPVPRRLPLIGGLGRQDSDWAADFSES